ncbi:LuxR C-terminal-related transcriptional regulator [Nocardia sp. BMG51109]|uniref:LuxR C-terminal-related transcriptional regulator n=1 Tax=Nocardia sp. BMG51109 TaxID=1056816 RepID=UPI0012EB6B7C|nr:LuxR C-terminal-related transcriptional regulator [Nocardia sp. BMG51109]
MPPVLAFVPLRMTCAQAALERATRAANGHTVLVCAPAGCGKTVLVADWLHRRRLSDASDTTVGWVNIGALATDTTRLWPAVSAALGLSAGPRASAIPDTPVDEAAAVISALSARTGSAVLVLDDAHLSTDPLMLAGLEYFVEHAPPSLTVVVVGRFDPPLRWHALEMTARLTRITGHDLALTETHIAELLAQHDCRLTDADLATVHRLTRGWAALVRIAAIHLAAHTDDRATSIAALAQSPRAVADFLVGELLTTLSPEAREFLLTTAVPTSFSVELAEELTGTTAARTLDLLLRNNFPLEATAHDGALWYTYHPMLRTYLLAETARTRPGRTVAIHRACAHWFTAAAMLPDALDHVLAEPDHPTLTTFVRDHGPRMVFSGNGAPLLRHLDALDAAANDPFVLALRIADALERADLVQAAGLRDLVDEMPSSHSVFAASNLVRPFADAVGYEVDLATGRGITAPPPPTPTGHRDIDCYIALAAAGTHTLEPGTRHGESQLRHALALAEQAGLPRLTLDALTRLALSAGLTGSLTLMRERAVRAVVFADDHDLNHTIALVQARLMIALMAYLQGDNDCLRTVDIVPSARQLDGSTAPAPGWHADVLTHLFAFDTAPDRHTVADTLRARMDRLLDETPIPATTGGLLIQVAWAMLRIRRTEPARRMLDRAVAALGRLPETVLVEAALAQDGHRYAAAVELIAPLLADDERLHPVSAVHARLLHASACHRLDRPAAAYEALHRALALAGADRLVRPFLDVPGAMELLDQYIGRFGHLDEFADTIRHRARAHTDTRVPSLTDTELTVLRQLPSGMTTSSLATDMGVSINTVKTHLRGIYHKLGVRTRADAIAHARTLGLI